MLTMRTKAQAKAAMSSGSGKAKGRQGLGKPNVTVTLIDRIDTFGDSFTVGVGATTPATGGWAYLYAAAKGKTLRNDAIAGTILQNRIDSTGSVRADNGLGRYQTALIGSGLSAEYDILYGFNDARYTGAPATINVTNFTTDYRAMLNGLIAAGVPKSSIRIGSPGYITDTGLTTGSTGFTGQTRLGFEAYVTAVKNLATEFAVTYIPVYEYMRDNGAASLISADNIHPNDAGHVIIKNIFVNPALYIAAAAPAADTTAPVIQSASINGSTLTLIYGEALNTTAPTLSSIGLVVDGAAAVNPTATSVSGSTVTATFATAVTNGQVVTLNYTAGAAPIKDTAGNNAANLSAYTVTNGTAAAGQTTYPQMLAGYTAMTESGTGPYTYTGSGAAALGTATVYGGVLNQSLQSGIDGFFSVKATVRPTTKTAFLGLQTGSAPVLANTIPYTVYASASSNNYVAVSSGTAQTVANTVAAAVGDIIRLRRTGTSIIGEVSKDTGTSWTTIYTWTSAPTTQLYYAMILTGTAAVDTLTTSGLA